MATVTGTDPKTWFGKLVRLPGHQQWRFVIGAGEVFLDHQTGPFPFPVLLLDDGMWANPNTIDVKVL